MFISRGSSRIIFSPFKSTANNFYVGASGDGTAYGGKAEDLECFGVDESSDETCLNSSAFDYHVNTSSTVGRCGSGDLGIAVDSECGRNPSEKNTGGAGETLTGNDDCDTPGDV